jgi:hypothetical protein
MNQPNCRQSAVAGAVPRPRAAARILHGKEGVDGSSPSEGLNKVPANWYFIVVCVLNTRTQFGHICGTRDAQYARRSTTSRPASSMCFPFSSRGSGTPRSPSGCSSRLARSTTTSRRSSASSTSSGVSSANRRGGADGALRHPPARRLGHAGRATPGGCALDRGARAHARRVAWIRSYVTAEPDGTVRTICIHQATSPEAIRLHASRADLPVDEIVKVTDTVIVRPDPALIAT